MLTASTGLQRELTATAGEESARRAAAVAEDFILIAAGRVRIGMVKLLGLQLLRQMLLGEQRIQFYIEQCNDVPAARLSSTT
jgi:hypothetical protein